MLLKISRFFAAVFLGLFVAVPLLVLALTALTGKPPALLERLVQGEMMELASEIGRDWNGSYLVDLAMVRRYRKAAINTLGLGVMVATLSSLLALPISLSFSRRLMSFRGTTALLVLLPLAMHSYLYAFAVILMFGKTGLFMRWFGFSPIDPFSVTGLVLVQTTAFLPLAVLSQAPALALYRSGWSTVARSLGADRWFSGFRVWLPMNLAAIAGGWLLVALRSMADFVTPMILTSARFRLLVLEAWRDLAGSNWWPGAAALSLELLIFCAIFLAVERWSLGKQPILGAIGFGEPEEASRQASWLKKASSLYAACLALIPVASMMLVAATSLGLFTTSGFTFDYYVQIENDLILGLGTSLKLGVAVVLVAFAFAVPFAMSQSEQRFWLTPAVKGLAALIFALPSTVYAISLVGVFNRPPLFLHFTPALLIIALAATRMNYSLRILSASWDNLGPDWQIRAAATGASPLFAFRWSTWPYLKASVACASALIFISSLHDIAISVMIAPPRFYPLALVIGRHIADGLFPQASALAMVLVAVLVIALAMVVQTLTLDDREGFLRG